MNDELTTQTPTAPIVLKLKKFDEHHPNVILPHASHLSVEPIDDSNSISSSLLKNDETSTIISNHSSPSSLRVKLKTSFLNGTNDVSDDEYPNSSLTDILTRPLKRLKNSASDDFNSHLNLKSNIDSTNESISSQVETEKFSHQIKQDHEPSSGSPLVLKIRRDSLTTSLTPSINSTSGISSTDEVDSNRQLLIKLKKNEHGDIVNSQTSSMSTEIFLTEQTISNNNDSLSNNAEIIHSNGHHELLYKTIPIQTSSVSSSSPPITNMLANLNENCQPSSVNNHNNQVPAVSTLSTSDQIVETHTKELLDEALDSVKNVLMQTFKKNLESGGDLNALKTTLGSDEVAEVFLAKLRQSLKRETTSNTEHIEQKSVETMMEIDQQRCETPTTIASPVMNVVSSPSSSSPLLPPVSTIINKTNSPSPSTILPSSPQSQTTTPTSNNKRKSSTPSTNPNRFDGATEEELSKRLLSDILQPNLDIVFVGINPSLYAVHKGHHYGGPGNHFWKLLHMSGLIPTTFTANDDYRMPQYGIGFTNIVQRPTKAGSDITKDEITAGAELLLQKIKMFRPKIVAFNGRGIYEVYAGNKHFHYGKQPETFAGTDTHVFVMPSSSARCSQLPRAEDKLPFYVGLRKLRDFVHGTLHSLNEAEITFPDIKIKDTDDALQKTIIRISNKPFSELSAEILKPFGDKIPSGQLVSKHAPLNSQSTRCSSPSPSSSPSLVFNTDALTTQTMSILHSTGIEQSTNLLVNDQQAQRVYLQNDGHYSPSPPPPHNVSNSSTSITVQPQRLSTNGILSSKTSVVENSPSNTNAAVLAALASGGHNSSPTFYQPTQTVYLSGVGGGQQQQQTVSYPTSSNNNNTTIISVRPSTVSTLSNNGGTMITNSVGNVSLLSSTSSHVIHHHPNSNASMESNNTPIHLSSTSSVLSRPVMVVNSSEVLPSFETILHPQTTNSISSPIRASVTNLTKDLLSSQTSTSKPTLILVPPTFKSITSNSSSVILPKASNSSKNSNTISMEKRTNDECLFVRYEREPSANTNDQYRFSFVIDEHSTSTQKRSRYVSINDL